MEAQAQKLKTAMREEVTEVASMGKQAAMSGAYIYPIKGITHFVSHGSLQKPLLRKIVPTIALSFVVITTMFIFTYLPQVAILTLVDGPLAIFNCVLLVLSESATIILALSRWWWIDDACVEVFDAVLVERNQTALVSQGRELKSTNSNDPIKKLGRTLKKPFTSESLTKSIARYLLMLPLNFIPIIGTVVFLTLQARRLGPANHARYFQLKDWSDEQRQSFIHENRGAYVAFGGVCVLLNLIPVANVAFAFTNTVAGALWAADIETSGKQALKKST